MFWLIAPSLIGRRLNSLSGEDRHLNTQTSLRTPQAPDRTLAIAGSVAGTLGCVASYAVDPASVTSETLCPFRALTGYQCPLCGGLRATHSLLRGDIGAAFAFNQLFVLALPALLYLGASTVVVAAGGRPLPVPRITRSWLVALVIVISSFWLLRNLF